MSLLTRVFVARGRIGISAVLFSCSDYMAELAANTTFMIISSLIYLRLIFVTV
ncbi:protein of unknown function [Moritella yayanosii]|uniref:Uncharacterized protein n=1 Tax=Moritella yayanosii TaxID=69539 RepID=A0A330LQG9_9GAMM|nr:protein of unknown function [Moritella yayanosii]